jgi:hypothetical protein
MGQLLSTLLLPVGGCWFLVQQQMLFGWWLGDFREGKPKVPCLFTKCVGLSPLWSGLARAWCAGSCWCLFYISRGSENYTRLVVGDGRGSVVFGVFVCQGHVLHGDTSATLQCMSRVRFWGSGGSVVFSCLGAASAVLSLVRCVGVSSTHAANFEQHLALCAD